MADTRRLGKSGIMYTTNTGCSKGIVYDIYIPKPLLPPADGAPYEEEGGCCCDGAPYEDEGGCCCCGGPYWEDGVDCCGGPYWEDGVDCCGGPKVDDGRPCVDMSINITFWTVNPLKHHIFRNIPKMTSTYQSRHPPMERRMTMMVVAVAAEARIAVTAVAVRNRCCCCHRSPRFHHQIRHFRHQIRRFRHQIHRFHRLVGRSFDLAAVAMAEGILDWENSTGMALNSRRQSID